MGLSSMVIDNILWEIYFAAEEKQDWDYKQASDAINWYITTGRACPAWIKSILKANPKKILCFMVSNNRNASTTGYIDCATNYLRRYCSYKA